MTRQETLEKLPLITAYANGKTIQYRDVPECRWEDLGHPTWTAPADCYRVKPEPREWVFWSEDNDDHLYHLSHSAKSKQVRVREILD